MFVRPSTLHRLMITAGLLSVCITASFAQTNWTWRNPVPTGNSLTAIAENAGVLMTVGADGTALASYDTGKTWASQSLTASIDFNEIVPSGNKFYGLGSSAYFITWAQNGDFSGATLVVTDVSNDLLPSVYSLAMQGRTYVVVGDNGLIATSPDSGTTWVRDTSPTELTLFHVLWSGIRFMGFGENGTVLLSANGTSWTSANPTGTAGISIRSAAQYDSLFVAVGSDLFNNPVILSSTNGTAWTKVSLSGLNLPASVFTRIIRSGTQFLVTGDQGTILTSPDGITWTALNSGIPADWNGVVQTASRVLVVGSGGAIAASGNETAWKAANSSVTTNDIFSAVWTGTQLVAVGENGSVLSSTNGVSWTVRDTGSSASLQKVIWTGSHLLAVGVGGRITLSSDGSTWQERHSSDSVNTLYGCAWTGAGYIAVGDGGTIITSPDGTTWTSQNSGVSNTLTGVTWTGTQFVAVGSNGTVLTSRDGTTWALQALPAATMGISLNDVASNSGSIVAVGEQSAIYTSTDGKNWTQAYLNFSGGSLQNVCWTGTFFAAVGTAGTVMASSPDSVSIFSTAEGNPFFSGCSQDFNGIAAMSGNKLVAVGSQGTIMTSGITLGVTSPERKKILPSIACHVAARRVLFSLTEPSHVTARLVTLSGKAITIAGRDYASGNHQIDLRAFNLSRGIYRLFLHTSQGDANIPITIMP